MFTFVSNRSNTRSEELNELYIKTKQDNIRKMNSGQTLNNNNVTFCDTSAGISVPKDTTNLFIGIVCFLSVSTLSYCFYIRY